MHFINTTACISSLLMATVSAGTSASFEVPAALPGTGAAPPEVDTTTVFETSTHYVTSAVTVTNSASNTTAMVTQTGYAPPPAEPVTTPSVSLYVTSGQTFVPVTLWEGSTTRVIFPQNSTAIEAYNSTVVEIPTGYPANGTSTVVATITASSALASATTPTDNTSSVSATPSVSEVPINSGDKATGSALLGMGVIAVLMAML